MRKGLPQHPNKIAVHHGLYLQIERYKVDGKSALGHAIRRVTDALSELFPNGPDGAAQLLMKRMAYKAIRLEVFENWDYVTGEANDVATGNYILISNSLRKDLVTLMAMAKTQTPPSTDPDLKEYLDTLRRAAKATVVNVEPVRRGPGRPPTVIKRIPQQ